MSDSSDTPYTQLYSDEPQWKLSEEVIFQFCCDSIERFSQEQEARVCSALCLEADLSKGYLWLSFETPEHDHEQAQEVQNHRNQIRKTNLNSAQNWKQALQEIQEHSLPIHSPGPENYEFALYSELDLDSWSDFALSEHYPADQPDYLKARAVILFWQVSQRLIEQQIVQELNLAFPFRLSYCIQGEACINLQILNNA